jgi:acyl-CoA thioester hydrolase
MARSDFNFSTRVRVRYAEIDGQMVVFNSRYLEYADIAITEYWRAVGLRDDPQWAALEFHVVRAVVDFKAPIRFDEEIDLLARTTRIGRSSMAAAIEIHGAGSADDLRAEIEIVNVHVDLTSGTPLPIPDWMRQTLTTFDAPP